MEKKSACYNILWKAGKVSESVKEHVTVDILM